MVHWLVLSVSNEFPESFFFKFCCACCSSQLPMQKDVLFFSNIDYTFFLVGRGESIGGAK